MAHRNIKDGDVPVRYVSLPEGNIRLTLPKSRPGEIREVPSGKLT